MSQVQKIVKQNPEFKGIFSGSVIEVEATIANKISDGRWKVSLPAELPSNLLYISLGKSGAKLAVGNSFEAVLTCMDADEGLFYFSAIQPILFRGISESVSASKPSSLKIKPKKNRK